MSSWKKCLCWIFWYTHARARTHAHALGCGAAVNGDARVYPAWSVAAECTHLNYVWINNSAKEGAYVTWFVKMDKLNCSFFATGQNWIIALWLQWWGSGTLLVDQQRDLFEPAILDCTLNKLVCLISACFWWIVNANYTLLAWHFLRSFGDNGNFCR